MQLHPLEQLMDIERSVVVVQPHHQPESYLARAQRIHEAPTESISRKRPSQGMDHTVERAFGFPYLFDAESKQLWIGGAHLLPLGVGLREEPSGAFGQHGDSGGDLGGLG